MVKYNVEPVNESSDVDAHHQVEKEDLPEHISDLLSKEDVERVSVYEEPFDAEEEYVRSEARRRHNMITEEAFEVTRR